MDAPRNEKTIDLLSQVLADIDCLVWASPKDGYEPANTQKFAARIIGKLITESGRSISTRKFNDVIIALPRLLLWGGDRAILYPACWGKGTWAFGTDRHPV